MSADSPLLLRLPVTALGAVLSSVTPSTRGVRAENTSPPARAKMSVILLRFVNL
jgi:hypothetical protein